MSPMFILFGVLGWMSLFVRDIPFLSSLIIFDNYQLFPANLFVIAFGIAIVHELYYRNWGKMKLDMKNVGVFIKEVAIDMGVFMFTWTVFGIIECGLVSISGGKIAEIYDFKVFCSILAESIAASRGFSTNILSKKSYMIAATFGIVYAMVNFKECLFNWWVLIPLLLAAFLELAIRKFKFNPKMFLDVIVDLGVYFAVYHYVVGAFFWVIGIVTSHLAGVPEYETVITSTRVIVAVVAEVLVALKYEYTEKTSTEE